MAKISENYMNKQPLKKSDLEKQPEENVLEVEPTAAPESTPEDNPLPKPEGVEKDEPLFSWNDDTPTEPIDDRAAARPSVEKEPAQEDDDTVEDANVKADPVEEPVEPKEAKTRSEPQGDFYGSQEDVSDHDDSSLHKFFETVSRLRHNVKNMYAPPLQPVKVVNCVFKTAQKHARDWGPTELRETPNYFDVFVSSYDWNSLYGIKDNHIAEKVSQKIDEKLERTGYRMEGMAIITFKEDASLDIGDVRVMAYFGTPKKKKSEDVSYSQAKRRQDPQEDEQAFVSFDVEENVVDGMTTPDLDQDDIRDAVEETFEEEVGNVVPDPTQPPEHRPDARDNGRLAREILGKLNDMAGDLLSAGKQRLDGYDGAAANVERTDDPQTNEGSVDEVTPPPSTPVARACLSWAGGKADVEPNFIIGVQRRDYGVMPNICLSKKMFPNAVSQDQGVFLYREGIWYFEHHGTYNTTVHIPRGDNVKVKILEANGHKAALCDGAQIVFADDALPVLTFSVS